MTPQTCAVLALACLAAGCSSGPRGGRVDVTGDARYHGGYRVGATYLLGAEAFLRGRPGGERLVPPEWASGNEARARPVPAGTRLRLNRVLLVGQQNTPAPGDWAYYVTPYATLLDGPYAGRTVNVSALSSDRLGPLPPRVNGRDVFGRPQPDLQLIEPEGPGAQPGNRDGGSGDGGGVRP